MNWRQEVAEATNAIDGVNLNTATITYKVDALDGFYVDPPTIYTVTREISVKSPAEVNAHLVDGINYKAGDFICRVAWAVLKAANAAKDTDPTMTVGGVVKTLPQVRPFTAAKNWGLELGIDSLTLGGDKWMIVGVRGLMWLDGEPSLVDLTLRK